MIVAQLFDGKFARFFASLGWFLFALALLIVVLAGIYFWWKYRPWG